MNQLSPSHRFRFTATGGDFFLLILKNVVLTVITFGIYAAWARTDYRKLLWQSVELDGHPFRFTGTGKELFIAYLKIFGIYLGVVATAAGLMVIDETLGAIAVTLLYLAAIFVITPIAIFGSRRYLFGRTTYRGIRFGVDAFKRRDFIIKFNLGILASIFSLGLYLPFFAVTIQRELCKASHYGDLEFDYDGEGSELFLLYLKGFLLSAVTLGIYYFAFMASMIRYHWNHTHVGGAKLRCELGGMDIFIIFVVQLAIPFTLGLATPWVLTFIFRTFADRMSLEGHIDFEAIHQTERSGDAVGEGLAELLDIA